MKPRAILAAVVACLFPATADAHRPEPSTHRTDLTGGPRVMLSDRVDALGFGIDVHVVDGLGVRAPLGASEAEVFMLRAGGGARLTWFPDVTSVGGFFYTSLDFALADHELTIEPQVGLFGARFVDRLTADGNDRGAFGIDVGARLAWRIYPAGRGGPFFMLDLGYRHAWELTEAADLGTRIGFHDLSVGIGLGGYWP